MDLFESLENFLKRLEVYTTIPPTAMVSVADMIIKILVELLSVLALATKQIKQGRFKKYVKLLWGKDKIQAALQRLDRLTNDEGLAAGAQTLAVVHGLADNEAKKMKRDRPVQHWLSPPDSSTYHDFVSKRHSGTAAWFFESNKLTEWKKTGSLLWIHGKPGAGKSTLLSAIIQDFERIHAAGSAIMAHYYFDFRDVKKQDCYGLLSSLISQLSVGSDSFYQVLFQLYSNHACGMHKPATSALAKCLKDMLSQPGQGPIFIIIDGLDECPKFPGTPSARGKVLELIKELIGLKLPNVHLCVASRPEIDIRNVLESLNSLQISLHDETGQEADIIAYIKSLVNSNHAPGWTEEDENLVINTLSQKANGMFRWVACQIDNVLRCYSNDIRGMLDELPKDLDETYERTLRDIDSQKRKYAHRLFQCLLVSIRPLRVEELAAISSVQFDATAPISSKKCSPPLDAKGLVLSTCSSLITVINQGGSQVVQFAHFSVKEFLTSERLATAEKRLSFYHILPEPAHTLLAHADLDVLLQLDDKIDKNTISHFPLAPYAARHWVDHAQFGDKSSHIQEAMERLFDPTKPHFAAWVWLHDIDRHWLEPMSKIHPTQPEAMPLYYASLCGFRGLVEHLITAHSSDVNSNGGSHTTPLHAASVKGHLDVASLLLKSGADPNSRDNAGRVPLHRVSQGGYRVTVESAFEIARLLVNFGANASVADHDGWTPLHAAAHCGYRDIAELLLGSGASLDVRNKNQETPLHLACSNGKLDVSHLLIDRHSDVNSRDKNGSTPLHSASRYGHVDIARLLLDGGSEVNVRETQEWSPLHQASRYGHLDVAQLLIDHGADVNAYKADRWTPLHLASNNGHLDIAKLLIGRSANINSRNDKGETPLDRAAEKGYLDVTRSLIKSRAAVSDANDQGWTPFHKASYHGHLIITKFLLECGIEIDIRNGNGQTSLYLASSSGKIDVVSFLIEKGADIHIRDNNSSNPLHIASHNGHLDVVQLLIKTGAHIDIRNGSQKTPLALASIKGKAGVGRFLIERRADINALDKRGQAPLHFASRHGHHDMARLLLDHGVGVNIQRDDLWSPLHLASANGHMKVTELLVQRGARVDMFNGKQETPLYQAVWNGEVAIASLLIDHRANLRITDSHGGTLLHAASQCGHLGVVKLLLQRGADVNVLNKANQTAAKLASENDQVEVARFIAEYKLDASIQDKVCSTTFDAAQYGADGDEKDEENPSLHAAAEEGNMDVLKSLLVQGADINPRNESHRTPLNLAAAKGNDHVVRLLIERGAEVDSCDKWGWTPLHAASRFGHLEVSRVLIDHDANVNARQKSNFTPLYLSARHGHVGIVKLLLERGADKHALSDKGETPYQASLRSRRPEIADLFREPSAG
ncbi:Ankyrin repeat-containing domain protein [Russula decolorans]